MTNITTTDLSQFGFREIAMAGELLKAYQNGSFYSGILGEGVQITLNRSSGCVFLTDEDFTVAMMNGDKLAQFFTCSNCGAEGFIEDFKESGDGNWHCKNCNERMDI